MKASENRLVWMDLEMTGLDPKRDRILEIAVIMTDGEMEVVSEGPTLAIHQQSDVLKLMDEWNRRTHSESGLIERVNSSTITERMASRMIMEFLKEHVDARTAPLCGNSIWQDRRFLVRYMPEVENHLHYRNIDVSTIKELARRWYPEFPTFKKNKSHTAYMDIMESMEEIKYYRRHIFVN